MSGPQIRNVSSKSVNLKKCFGNFRKSPYCVQKDSYGVLYIVLTIAALICVKVENDVEIQ